MEVARDTPAYATSGPGRRGHGRTRVQAYGPAALVLALGALLTSVAWTITSNLERARLRSEFEHLAQDRETAITGSIDDNLRALRALSARCEDRYGILREEFKKFTALILSENHGIQALEWIPRVPDAERAAYEQTARQDGLEGFQITELDANGELRRAARRDEYFPVFYVEPLHGNERALGFDLASSVPRAATLAQARDSGELVVAPPVKLVQEQGDQCGTLMLIPQYRPGAPLETVEQRRTALLGFVLGVYRVSDLLEVCVAPLPPAGIDIWLTDRTTLSDARMLARHVSRTRRLGSAQLSTDAPASSGIGYDASITLGGRLWNLRCTPAPAFYANRPSEYRWIVLGAGTLCTLLLTLYVWQAARHTQQVERQVAERTRALVEANTALSHEVPKRDAVEHALRESELKFRTLVERIPAVTYTAALDAARTTTYVSPQIEHYLGYLPGDYRSEPDLWSRALHEEDRARVLAEVAACQTTGGPLVCDYRLRTRDGRMVWFHDEAVLVRDDRGQPLFLQGVQFDITDRRQAEDAARRQSELLSTVLNNIPHFVFWKDRDSVYLGCNANFARVAGLANPADVAGKIDYDLAWTRAEADVYRQRDREVMERNQPLLDIEETLLQADGRETGILTSKVPLHDAEGHVTGILGIYADITERKRAEEVLHSHLEQIDRERVNLQALFDSAQVGFLLLNEQAQVVRVNDAAARLVGKDSAQMVGRQPGNALCCIHAAAAPNGCGTGQACPHCPIRMCLTRVLGTGKPVRGMEVNQVLQINGQPRSLWLSISATLVKLDDLRHVLVAITDITERKRAEESLVEVKTAVDLSMNGIAMADLDGHIRFANPAWARMHGYSVEELTGRHWNIFHTREQLEAEVNPFIGQLLETGSGESEIGHVRRDGTTFPAWMSCTLLRDANQKPIGWVETALDITERKRAEEALRQSEERFRLAAQSITNMIWQWDLVTGKLDWFGDIEGLLGYPPGEFPHTVEAWEALVDPEDHDRVMAALDRHHKTDAPFDEEYRVRRKDGGICHWRARGAAIRDAQGNAVRMFGAIENVTERKRAEEAVRESENRYRSLFESSRDAIMIVEPPSWKFTSFNRAAVELCGVKDVERLLSLGPWDISPERQPDGRTSAEKAQAMIEAAMREGSHFFEWRFRRGNADEFPGTVLLTRLEQAGKVMIQGTIRDITEQKRAEAEREKRLLRQQGVSQLRQLLLTPAPLEAKLKSVTDGIVRLFEADFCRIWLIRPGDRCERDCLHAKVHEGPHVCRHRDRCLHLLASSGRYTHVDGPGHRRVPFGCYKIGRVAADEERGFLTNDVQTDPRVHNHDWARELGLVSFAGYRLRAPGGETLGVLALFAKHPLSADDDAMLDGLRSTVALTIQQATAEEALRESEARVRAITDSAQDAIISTDSEGRVGFWNPAAERIFGYTASEAVGRNVLDLAMLPQEQEAERRNLAEIARTGTAPLVGKILEHSALRKDGSQFPSEVSISTYRDIEGVRVIAIVRDVTDRKQAETKLEALHRQLLDASRQAGMAEVAAGVLHNVGNVLNSLNVSAMLVADKVRASRVARLAQVADLLRAHIDDLGAFVTVDEKGRQLPNYVLQLAEHLTSDQSAILGELDGLTKNVEHIKSIINMQQGYARNVSLVEPVALAGLLDEVLKMNAASFEHHGLTVVCDYADAPVVTVDKHMVLQVLVNLIRNAKHALRDSGRPDKRLTVRAARDGDEFVRIEVCDNGVGIAAEDLTRIWEYGFTTKKDGNGVGLHNSALAAKAIGGSLGAHSDGPGQGATFVFEIPMRVGESAHV
jgi:PAS domain S-box-containing protein